MGKFVCINCRLSLNLSRRLFSSSSSRPPTAPKPLPNVRHIRDNAELYSRNCVDRNYAFAAQYPFQIQSLASKAAELQQALKPSRSQIKQLEREIGARAAKRLKQDQKEQDEDQESMEDAQALDRLRESAKKLRDSSQRLLDGSEECAQEIHRLALLLPNLTSSDTPVGSEPKVVGYINFDPNRPPTYLSTSSPGATRSHVAIGTELGLLDFTSSATAVGWGWYYLINGGCLLEYALTQYALTVARKNGWKPVSPPSIVYSHIAEACGFQPRDAHNEQQIWSIQQTEKDKTANKPQRSLAGTAEIPLAAMYAGQEIQGSDLPIKLVGASRCYRAEAGSRGVDTKGLYRVHEFTKVELFGFTDSSDSSSYSSTSLFEDIMSIQSEILRSLNLPCRILEMSSTDLGASATRKRDIEVLFPSRVAHQGPDAESNTTSLVESTGWGEVSSTSICTDYQSRRLGIRMRTAGGSAKPALSFPHTVNGTAMAVPRVLAAILEHGWDEELRGVVVPEVLRPWMDGIDIIKAQK